MERFNQLKEEYLNAPNRAIAYEKLDELSEMVKQEPEKYGEAFFEIGQHKLTELKALNVKASLMEVSEFVSLSYIAKNYFKKSKEWLYQRINGNIVNGKPAQFTDEEIGTLNNALQDLSKRLGSVRVA